MFPLERFQEDGNNSRKSKVSRNLNFVAELSFLPIPKPPYPQTQPFHKCLPEVCGINIIQVGGRAQKKKSCEEHKSAILEGSWLPVEETDETFTPLSSLLLWVFLSPLPFGHCVMSKQRTSLAEAQSCCCVQIGSLQKRHHRIAIRPEGQGALPCTCQIKATRELQTRYLDEV